MALSHPPARSAGGAMSSTTTQQTALFAAPIVHRCPHCRATLIGLYTRHVRCPKCGRDYVTPQPTP